MNREMLDGLKAYLSGLGRSKRDALVLIAGSTDLSEAAAREMERRAAAFLTELPHREVLAIALGEVDLRELARQVLAEIDKEKARGKA